MKSVGSLLLGMFIAAVSNSCLDVIAMSLMAVAAAQIDILNETITDFKNYCDESKVGTDSYIRYLNQRVKLHNEIIRYTVFSYTRLFLIQITFEM